MIRRMSHTSVFVLDQDRAKKFYTEKLGFEVKTDAKMGDFRWLTVGPKGQSDLEVVLMPIRAGMMMPEDACTKLKSLVEGGFMGAGVFETADCKKTYEELGDKIVVVFTSAPPKPTLRVSSKYTLSSHEVGVFE